MTFKTLQNKGPQLFSLLFGLVFFAYGAWVLFNGHFHEDAYILFVYVENILNGQGITFYPGGPPTEGATDFLWLMLLVLLGFVGLNVGVSVVLLNTLSVIVICYILLKTIDEYVQETSIWHSLIYLLAFLWLGFPTFYAAIGGFSVYVYMATILVCFKSIHTGKHFHYTPYIALIIAMLRPDGVIIGFGFVTVGLFQAHQANELKRYVVNMLLPLVIAVAYFLWRYSYFGLLLPLPLYVKSVGAESNGLVANVSWMVRHIYLLLPAALLVIYNRSAKRYIGLLLPGLLLFIALAFATQSQNVGFRFQGPIFILLYYIFVVSVLEYLHGDRKQKLIDLAIAATMGCITLLGAYDSFTTSKSITRFYYMNSFPQALNTLLPRGSKIALTEAGRLAYWSQPNDPEILDVVGLNSELPATKDVTVGDIEVFSPDLIMFHRAEASTITNIEKYQGKSVVYLSDSDIAMLEQKHTNRPADGGGRSKVSHAAIVLLNFVQKHKTEYDVYLVDFGKNNEFPHMYAIRKSLDLDNRMNKLLVDSFDETRAQSFMQMLDKKAAK